MPRAAARLGVSLVSKGAASVASAVVVGTSAAASQLAEWHGAAHSP